MDHQRGIGRYLLWRVLQVVPTVLLVSVLVFGLIQAMPGDRVEAIMERDGYNVSTLDDPVSYAEEYQRIARREGFDKPTFYVSIVQKGEEWHYPQWRWHGMDNQYHRWISGLIGGKPAVSAVTGQSVHHLVQQALGWSLSLAVLAIVAVCAVGIPLGFLLHRYALPRLEALLFFMHSLPAFWLAILLIVFFTTSEYGSWTDILPSPGIWSQGTTAWQGIIAGGQRLLIPLLVLVVKDLAFVTQLVKASADRQSSTPYYITARSKGLSHRAVLWHHIAPNTMIPIVTVIIDALPRAIAGLLLLEVICNIPGMGRLLYGAILNQDYDIVLYITMLIAVATSIIYIIGDIVYAIINPKLSLR